MESKEPIKPGSSEGIPAELSSEMLFILDQARYAPSADNLQPWKFIVKNTGTIELRLNELYISNYCDAGFAAPCISAGAVLENMRVAARSRGLEIKIEYLPDPQDPMLAAVVSLTPGNTGTQRHADAITKRHTNRKFYRRGKTVPDEIYGALAKQAEGTGAGLKWLRKKDPAYGELARIIGEADQLRFEIPRLHREFMEILRFGKEAEDGLTILSLDAGPSAGILFPAIRSWDRLAKLNRIGMSYSFNLYARMQILSSSAVGLITMPGKALEDYVRGGEVMERIWHELTLQGLAMQPMEALPIFLINKEATGGKDLAPAQKKTIENLAGRFYTVFDMSHEAGLIMLFRIGYASPVSKRSSRRALASFLQVEHAAARGQSGGHHV